MKKVIPIYTLIIFNIIPLYAVNFSGTIDGDSTWTKSNSPYYITGDVTISDQGSLLIEPGVEVLFNGNYSFTNEGLFRAIGVQNDSIYFRPAIGNSNGWKGIIFDSPSADLKLDFCSISGASASGININSGFITITNSISYENSGRGLNVTNGNVTAINCVFKNNSTYGIYLGSTANATLYAVRISNNQSYGISLPSATLAAYNSIIDNNISYGIYTSNGNITLRNVVISDNTTGLLPQNGNINISNSIIYSNGGQSIASGTGTINVQYSDIEGGFVGSGNIGDDPEHDNPLFLNDKYELQGISPCLNTGNPDILYNDQYFPPSVQGVRNDMGAYGGSDACKWYYPLNIDPDTVNYGSVDYADSVSEIISFINYSGDILNLDSIFITGFNKDKFKIINMSGSFPIVLGENESIQFEVEFSPEIANPNPYTALLNLKSEKGTKTAYLSGKGVWADIFIANELEDTGYNFGNIDVGNTESFDLIIKNYGTGKLKVNDIIMPDEYVFIENFQAFEIPPNSTIAETLLVNYKPLSADTLSDSLIIVSNDPQYNGHLPIGLFGVGRAPEIETNKIDLDFDDLDVFSSVSDNISIDNSGNKDLILNNVFINGPAAGQFNLLTEINSDTIPVGGDAVDLDVAFSPTGRGTKNAVLNVVNNDPNTDTLKINLRGKGIAADLSVNAGNIDFGNILISKDTTAIIEISNVGEHRLTVDTLYLEKEIDSDFELESGATSFSIEPEADPYLAHVRFAPKQDIGYTAQLIIVSNDYLDDTLRIEITGRGITPHIAYGSGDLNFNNVWLEKSLSLFREIRNEGSANLKIKNINVAGNDAAYFNLIITGDSLEIHPNGSDSLEIQFSPESMKQYEAQLKFECNDLDTPDVSINLSGTGVAALISSNTSLLDFGNVKSDTTVYRSFKLENTGNTNLEIRELLIENNRNEAFQIVNPVLPIVIPPQSESGEISMLFHTDKRMVSNAILNVISNAYQQDTLKIDLDATSNVANLPYLYLFSDSINSIGSAIITDTLFYPLNISNKSDDARLTISNLLISGEDSDFFDIDSSGNSFDILPLGTSSRRILKFFPNELRSYSIQLHIYSTDTIASPNTYAIFASGIIDPTPPQIMIDTSATQLTLNSGGKFQTKISDSESKIQSAKLFIRKTGSAQFDSLNLTGDPANIYWSTDLNPDLMTTYGLQYYLKVVHGGAKSICPDDGKVNPLSLTIKIPEYNFPKSTLAEEYQMISIPFNSNGQTLRELIGDELGSYDNTQYRIFDWDQADSSFKEQTDMKAELPPGKALYLITKEPRQLNITNCRTVLTDKAYTINLTRGWNMISIPFAFNVLWSDIYPKTNGTDLKYWDGTGTIFPDTLEPFRGYGFYANEDTILSIPVMEALPGTAMTKPVPELKSDEWYIQIEARKGKYTDRYNFAGVRHGSVARMDHWDSYESPGIGDYISLYFTEENDKNSVLKLCADYKNSENEFYQFDFEYNSTFLGKTLLNLVAKNLPDTYDWGVVTRDGDILLPKGEISSNLQTRKYRLIVGNRDYINSVKSEFSTLPEQFKVSQNYPNPFNPVTKITIALPKEAYITVDIYNILGERVKRLVNNVLTSEGYHEFSWNGKNEHNFLVSSGIYFLTFSSPEYRKTIKMILQK